jgi:hypothetical protein
MSSDAIRLSELSSVSLVVSRIEGVETVVRANWPVRTYTIVDQAAPGADRTAITEIDAYKVVHTIDLPPAVIDHEVYAAMEREMAALIDEQVVQAISGGYPPGYDHRTGMPGALTSNPKPSPYGNIIDLDMPEVA